MRGVLEGLDYRPAFLFGPDSNDDLKASKGVFVSIVP